MFRYDRPQKGRQRQFHQLGAECFGVESELADAEMIGMLAHLCEDLSINSFTIMLNSLGCRLCRPAYVEKLKSTLMPLHAQLCPRCQERIAVNPLRVFDCKEESCQNHLRDAPLLIDSLCAACAGHFAKVQGLLNRLSVPFQINPRIVRGLDYYTRTAFEFVCSGLGAQNTLIGGGRYDNLVENMGGTGTPAIGFGMGLERAIELITANQKFPPKENRIYMATLGENAAQEGLILSSQLRRQGFNLNTNYCARSLKSQLKRAQQDGYPVVLILGDQEVAEKKIIMRDLARSQQQEISLEKLAGVLNNWLATHSLPGA